MRFRTVVPALVIAACAATASAEIILGNYPIANDLSQTAGVNNTRHKALAFTMPAGVDYTITSVTLRLGNFDANDTAFLEIRDHTGSTTAPGATVLGTFTAPAGTGAAPADYIFTPNGTITLAAGASYWIYLHGAAAPSSFDWKASSPGITPTGVATYGPGNLFTTNGGASWGSSSTLVSFEINGVPVPAPSTAAFLGLAGLAAFRRRR